MTADPSDLVVTILAADRARVDCPGGRRLYVDRREVRRGAPTAWTCPCRRASDTVDCAHVAAVEQAVLDQLLAKGGRLR